MVNEAYIPHINEIVAKAVMYGGDDGGPYRTDYGGLKRAVDDFLAKLGIDDMWALVEDVYCEERMNGRACYCHLPQIMRKR